MNIMIHPKIKAKDKQDINSSMKFKYIFLINGPHGQSLASVKVWDVGSQTTKVYNLYSR